MIVAVIEVVVFVVVDVFVVDVVVRVGLIHFQLWNQSEFSLALKRDNAEASFHMNGDFKMGIYLCYFL